MFDCDMGYKEVKALFLVIQSTSSFKDTSFKVLVSSTSFDWKNVSMVGTSD